MRVVTDIVDMDNNTKLKLVTRIDVEGGVVWRGFDPARRDLMDGGFAEYPTRFRSIYPIHAGRFQPYLVHCYGRLDVQPRQAQLTPVE